MKWTSASIPTLHPFYSLSLHCFADLYRPPIKYMLHVHVHTYGQVPGMQ